MVIFNYMRYMASDEMRKIYKLLFVRTLADGTLTREKFALYLQQDILYLKDNAKAFNTLEERFSSFPHPHSDRYRELCKKIASDVIEAEHKYRVKTLKDYAKNLTVVTPVSSSLACLMYTNYLLWTARHAPVEVAVASMLACFWVYQQVGEYALGLALERGILDEHPYKAFIESCTSSDFKITLASMITMVNELGEAAASETRDSMRFAFLRGVKYEHRFFSSHDAFAPYLSRRAHHTLTLQI